MYKRILLSMVATGVFLWSGVSIGSVYSANYTSNTMGGSGAETILDILNVDSWRTLAPNGGGINEHLISMTVNIIVNGSADLADYGISGPAQTISGTFKCTISSAPINPIQFLYSYEQPYSLTYVGDNPDGSGLHFTSVFPSFSSTAIITITDPSVLNLFSVYGESVNFNMQESLGNITGPINDANLSDFSTDLTVTYNTSNPVPEPSTIILLGAGLAGLGLVRRRGLGSNGT